MGNVEHRPAHLMVGLDGKPVRLVEKGAVVAGIYDVIEYVPASYLQGAVARAEKAEAYAKEGWDWLAEALESLGVETVFDIPTWKARRAASSE